MAPVVTVTGKPLSKEMADIYFVILGDLPLPILRAAVQKVVASHIYNTLPTPGAFRQAAVSLMHQAPLAIEAWGMVTRYVRGQIEYEVLPLIVRRAACEVGWHSLRFSEQAETLRAQFLKAYDSIVSKERDELSLPAAARAQIAALDSMFPRLE